MGEQGHRQRPILRVLPGGGQGAGRPPEQLLPPRHTWLILVGVTCLVLAAAGFLMAPAFSHRPPRITEAQAAAVQAVSEGTPAFVGGLAELLGLDAAATARLDGLVREFDRRREPLRRDQEEALGVLRLAAGQPEVEAATVDRALARLLAAQAALQALDAELTERATAGLSPSQRARAALLLGQFQRRVGTAPGR